VTLPSRDYHQQYLCEQNGHTCREKCRCVRLEGGESQFDIGVEVSVHENVLCGLCTAILGLVGGGGWWCKACDI
jgi:hypothetical protein